jgi:hypothetical protein
MLGKSKTAAHHILSKSLGSDWSIDFTPKKLKYLHEKVRIKIPALVDDATIRKIKAKVEANKTITHGPLKNKYLLSRMIFCEKCGYALTGAPNHNNLIYRHQIYLGCKQAWNIRADVIEPAVFDDLYRCLGDAVKCREAMASAIPDPWRRKALEDQCFRTLRELAKNEQQRNNLIDAVCNAVMSNDEAKEKMLQLRMTQSDLQKELSETEELLASIPSKEMIVQKAQLLKRLTRDYFKSRDHLSKMTYDDKKGLLQSLFNGKTNDGKRYGVYINRSLQGKRFMYTIKGNFEEITGSIKLNTVSQDDR